MAASSFIDMATSHADRTAGRLAAVAGIRRAPTPRLVQFMLPRFLDTETCAALIERIDRDVRPSTIADPNGDDSFRTRSEEHQSELQSLMRISYAVFCLKKKTK